MFMSSNAFQLPLSLSVNCSFDVSICSGSTKSVNYVIRFLKLIFPICRKLEQSSIFTTEVKLRVRNDGKYIDEVSKRLV